MALKMKDVEIGGIYYCKVSGRVICVRIESDKGYTTTKSQNGGALVMRKKHLGWIATNLETKRQILVRSATRLRSRATVVAKSEAPPSALLDNRCEIDTTEGSEHHG